MTTVQNDVSDFGSVLKHWRKRRRLSQFELSMVSNTSARHISFLERGRSKPSREMVHRLAQSLEIPSSEVNVALAIAGFAPLFPSTELDSDDAAALKTIIQSMLDKHMPWPAVVSNSEWDLVNANAAGTHLLELIDKEGATNVLQALLESDHHDGPILNWPEIARLMLYRLNTEQMNNPSDKRLQGLREHLSSHPRIEENLPPEKSTLTLTVPLKIQAEKSVLSLLSMNAQFAGVQELTYRDIHIELFFPEDEATNTYFHDYRDPK